MSEQEHLNQIKDRLPIEMAEKIDSWSRCLTAVLELKQHRNNCDIELVEHVKLNNAVIKKNVELEQALAVKDKWIKEITNKYAILSDKYDGEEALFSKTLADKGEEIKELKRVLTFTKKALDSLPRSFGFEITHAKQINKVLEVKTK